MIVVCVFSLLVGPCPQELAAAAVSVGATELRAVLAADLLADLDDLDVPALQYRLGNLTSELRERAKWEALRQHDCWRRAEVEAWGKYGALLKEQRHEISRRHESEVRADAERAFTSQGARAGFSTKPRFFGSCRRRARRARCD